MSRADSDVRVVEEAVVMRIILCGLAEADVGLSAGSIAALDDPAELEVGSDASWGERNHRQLFWRSY